MTTVSAYRLPTNVQPLKYDLTLTPNLDTFTFAGEESIDLQVSEAVTSIAVNAIELEILEASADPGGRNVAAGPEHRDGRGDGDRDLRLRPGDTARERDPLHKVHRNAERPATGLLPQPVHRPGRPAEDSGNHPVRSHGRAPSLPMLGRPRGQGHLPGDPCRPIGPGSHIQHPAGERDAR